MKSVFNSFLQGLFGLPPSGSKRSALILPSQYEPAKPTSRLLPESTRVVRSLSAVVRKSDDPLDEIILTLPIYSEDGILRGHFHWTLGDLFEGTQVFGGTGSGKSSGSGKDIGVSFLRRGMGGLILTAKATDLEDWIGKRDEQGRLLLTGRGLPVKPGYLHAAGRDAREGIDYIVLGEGSEHCYNFLDAERTRTNSLTHNIVSLFLTAVESGADKDSHEDAYWTNALRQLLTNAVDLVMQATGGLTLTEIEEVIGTAPQNIQEARSDTWQQSTCCKYLEQAQRNLDRDIEAATSENDSKELKTLRGRVRTLKRTVSYWMLDFPALSDRTRSVVVSSFTAQSTGLTSSPIFEMLCDRQTVDIVEATRQGQLVFVNLPVERFAELGRFAQVLIKTVWQRAVKHTPNQEQPVFLWADESQFFVTKEDMLFQTTARSAGCATVYLTQSISNYYAVMNGRNSTAATDSLLGNLTTKIFHANGDPATNDWAQRLFGDAYVDLGSGNVGHMGQTTHGYAKARSPLLFATDFIRLRRGRADNDYKVGAILFRAGKDHPDGSVVFRTEFDQRP